MCGGGCRGVTPVSSAAIYQVQWGLRGDFLPSGTMGHSGEDTRVWWMEVWKCEQGGPGCHKWGFRHLTACTPGKAFWFVYHVWFALMDTCLHW